MSVVASVLKSLGELQKDDLNTKIEKLARTIEGMKVDVQQMIQNDLVEFVPCYTDTLEISKALNAAVNDAQMLLTIISREVKPQLGRTATEFQDMSKQLEEVVAMADLTGRIMQVHAALDEAEELRRGKKYVEAATTLKETGRLLAEMTKNGGDSDVFRALKTELAIRQEKLIFVLGKEWEKFFVWKSTPDVPPVLPTVELTILLPRDQTAEEASSTIRAMNILGELQFRLKCFGKKFMNDILMTILKYPTEVEVTMLDSFCLKLIRKGKEKPEPSLVFENLTEVFRFLQSSLSKFYMDSAVPSPVEEGDVRVAPRTLVHGLGSLLSEEFCKSLIQECLAEAIPSQSEDLAGYSVVIDMTSNLQNMMVEVGFLKSDHSELLQYARNIDVHFANKMCKDILVRAHAIMKEDLHNTVTVPLPEEASTPPEKVAVPQSAAFLDFPLESSLSQDFFKFPKCQVSVSTQKIVDLLREVLEESTRSSPTCAYRLFYTARQVCELYQCVVPVFHKETIESFPQQTAIFHNNCMYLGHHFLLLGPKYGRRLPRSSGLSGLTFVDLVVPTRKLGTDAFLSQMRRQRDQLLEFLQNRAAFQMLGSDTSSMPAAERPIRQCLHLLQSLKRVWSTVLPQRVYYKAIGTLLNSCVENIVATVTSLEDITADCACQLDSLFGTVIAQAPDLFKVEEGESNELALVSSHVSRWQRFRELRLVLTFSMKEIVERWADGKGPLAAEFTADEVKQLIRALFQNTDRRAAVLAKIW